VESIPTCSCKFIGFKEQAFRVIRYFTITIINVCFAIQGTIKNNRKPLLFSINLRILCCGQLPGLIYIEFIRINDGSILIVVFNTILLT
jgi:hypothetical protein